jgi:hypothetical protein
MNCKSIVTIGLGLLSVGCSLSSFIPSAVADTLKIDKQQDVRKIQQQRFVQLSGNLVPPRLNLSYPIFQTNCSEIRVSLFRGDRELASTQASGSYITNGCTYNLTFRHNVLATYQNPNYLVTSVGGRSGDYTIFGRDNIPQPLPSQFDLKVDKSYTGPK